MVLSPAYSRGCLIEDQRGDVPSDFPEWPPVAVVEELCPSMGWGRMTIPSACCQALAGSVACSEAGDGGSTVEGYVGFSWGGSKPGKCKSVVCHRREKRTSCSEWILQIVEFSRREVLYSFPTFSAAALVLQRYVLILGKLLSVMQAPEVSIGTV